MAADPLSIVNAWTNDVWHDGHLHRVCELVTDPCIRHDPGSVHPMSVDENIDRVRHGREQFPGMRFENSVTVVEGDLVTSCYTMRWMVDGAISALSGMEVFRVVDGRICETWNVPPVAGEWR